MTNEEIKRIFLENGFSIKDGQSDLKPYVYQAARALLASFEPEISNLQNKDARRYKYLRRKHAWKEYDLQKIGSVSAIYVCTEIGTETALDEEKLDIAIDAAILDDSLAAQPFGNSEQLTDWAKDRNEFPQKGLGQ